MLSGGVVAHVEGAARDDLGEAGEASFPEGGARAGFGDCTFHARGFFAAGASIDHQRQARGEQREQIGFERIGDALRRIFADSQADREM